MGSVAGNSGAPPLGELQFSADFEGGNIGDVRRVADNEYEISVRHDTNNPRQRLWFYFKAQKRGPGRRSYYTS